MTEKTWIERKDKAEWGRRYIESNGFIHCSTIEYFWRVALNFKNVDQKFVLICIDENKLISEIRYEDDENTGRYYPHVYGLINNSAVVHVLPYLKDADGNYIKNAELNDIENK